MSRGRHRAPRRMPRPAASSGMAASEAACGLALLVIIAAMAGTPLFTALFRA